VSAELIRGPQVSPLTAADIDEAAVRIAGVVTQSPLQFSDRLSQATGAQVYLKREDLQAVRSYKLRGAYNLLMQLTPDELAAGVVCSSAGNHAQGFALACRSMGVHGRVYVPAKTPKQKRDRIRYHGGEFIELIVGGKTYDLAAQAALDDVARTGATLVPPYDDPRTMAGQGTIAVELLEQLPGEPDLVIVPVGGGGCIAGITTYLSERTTNSAVLGAEPAGALSVAALMEADVEPGSTVVCIISGGNNDVSRYGEILERSLVHRGLKHYFLVDFPQEPGALRGFLDSVLGPNDDITLFEYVKRNNRETGEALVGIELGSSTDLDGLLQRMHESEAHVERLEPGSPTYRYLT
jgi:threonine dehydratase